MNRKRLLPILLAAMLLLAAIPVGFAAASTETATAPHSGVTTPVRAEGEETLTAPKYVFLFIGDGMTYPQFHRVRLLEHQRGQGHHPDHQRNAQLHEVPRRGLRNHL